MSVFSFVFSGRPGLFIANEAQAAGVVAMSLLSSDHKVYSCTGDLLDDDFVSQHLHAGAGVSSFYIKVEGKEFKFDNPDFLHGAHSYCDVMKQYTILPLINDKEFSRLTKIRSLTFAFSTDRQDPEQGVLSLYNLIDTYLTEAGFTGMDESTDESESLPVMEKFTLHTPKLIAMIDSELPTSRHETKLLKEACPYTDLVRVDLEEMGIEFKEGLLDVFIAQYGTLMRSRYVLGSENSFDELYTCAKVFFSA